MGIVFGCVVPHPPILVPEIGHGQEKSVAATSQAMKKLAEKLAACKPEALLVISPHGNLAYDAMGIATASHSAGDLSTWGASTPRERFDTEPGLVAAIQKEAKAGGIPVKSIGQKGYGLDHGVMVPLYFLLPVVRGLPLVPLTFSLLPLEQHFAFGQAVGKACQRAGKRVAIVASGDLSHRLLPGAPAGYDPAGKVFDEKIVAALSRLDSQAVLGLDEALVESAGECGLRSIVILLGALQGLEVKPEVLSYEGPFGVGYLVASFEVLPSAHHPIVELARETVESYVRGGETPKVTEPSAEMKGRAGVFVSIKKHGELRGCIGTFEPAKATIAEEIITNAISSATRDPRFPPVEASELADLEYSVDILTAPEPIDNVDQLDATKYGVIVQHEWRRGLLLPDLEGVETPEQQIQICRLKAGIGRDEPVKLYRFEVRRFK